jgi:hypothetical protein
MTKSFGQVDVNDDLVVLVEDDPTPLVRVVARLMRLALPHADAESLAGASRGGATVSVRSAHDAQAFTCTFAPGSIGLRHGSTADADAALVVDVAKDLALDSETSSGDAALQELVDALMHPPVPSWREAAHEFWHRTSADRGMPQELVVHCTDEDDQLVLGDGIPTYTLSATSADLARVLSGTAPLLESVFSGAVAIRGTLPQLSVMAGASNKVRFDV